MTLSNQINLNEHDSIANWVSTVASDLDLDRTTVWNLLEKIVLEDEVTNRVHNETRLKVLYELHLNDWSDESEGPPGKWIDLYFKSGDISLQFQFSFGAYSFGELSQKEITTLKRIMREENLEAQYVSDSEITMCHRNTTAEAEIKLTNQILTEVFGTDFEALNYAEESGSHIENHTWDDPIKYR